MIPPEPFREDIDGILKQDTEADPLRLRAKGPPPGQEKPGDTHAMGDTEIAINIEDTTRRERPATDDDSISRA